MQERVGLRRSTDEWIIKLAEMYAMGFYLDMKKDNIMSFREK